MIDNTVVILHVNINMRKYKLIEPTTTRKLIMNQMHWTSAGFMSIVTRIFICIWNAMA